LQKQTFSTIDHGLILSSLVAFVKFKLSAHQVSKRLWLPTLGRKYQLVLLAIIARNLDKRYRGSGEGLALSFYM